MFARLTASLVIITISRMRKAAPLAHSSGIFKFEVVLRDSKVGRIALSVASEMLLLMNSVWLMLTSSSSQCCSKIFMRWCGKWISFVSLDLSETAKQLNISEINLQVIGSFSFVNDEIVQLVDDQELFCGRNSVIDKLPCNLIVKVWNRASEVGLEVAFMDECAVQVRPTMWMSWLNNFADFNRTPS